MRVGINRFCEDGHIKVELSAYKSVRLGSFDSTVSGMSLPTEMQITYKWLLLKVKPPQDSVHVVC